eukprot:438315-Amphidinium_carterae.1
MAKQAGGFDAYNVGKLFVLRWNQQDSNLYHVPIVYGARLGEAITVWDLHVGAEVDILGRMTTLRHCTQMTAQWNKYWADRHCLRASGCL